MKNGLVIADAGPIFSLAIIDKLQLLDTIFSDVKISAAVWEEISVDKTTPYYKTIETYFISKVVTINGINNLTFIMDYGESESVILYKELKADFLLIDDKKARIIAENFGINCIGSLGILSRARHERLIGELRPIFKLFQKNNRYYSIRILNLLLSKHGEKILKNR